MKIVFISNFYNHHQSPFSRAISTIVKGQYVFLETDSIDTERIKLGYQILKDCFVYSINEDLNKTLEYIANSDVVIEGNTSRKLIKDRVKSGRLIFHYGERIYKNKPKWYEIPARFVKYWYMHGKHKNIYLLCSSAYAYADYEITKTFTNRAYKWGYFPETIKYDIDKLLTNKKKNKIIWVGRLLDWKHPDDVLTVSKRLKDNHYSFETEIIGEGYMRKELENMIIKMGLSNHVKIIGAVSSKKIRKYMEDAGIFVFTSDRHEGWGAVLNEAMNSGCAVVASHAIGSVPFLLKDKENGIIYESGNVNSLYEKVKSLLDDCCYQVELGKKAYFTIIDEWNAEIAAKRIVELSKAIIGGNAHPSLYTSGPCSKSEIVEDDWYK